VIILAKAVIEIIILDGSSMSEYRSLIKILPTITMQYVISFSVLPMTV
jgi:hypothetical protein